MRASFLLFFQFALLWVCFTPFSPSVGAELHFNRKSTPGFGKVKLSAAMIETSGDIAETFEKNLQEARETGNLKKARDAVNHLTGLAMAGVGAKDLGRYVFHNLDNEPQVGESGDDKTYDVGERPLGLWVRTSANVRLDRQAIVELDVAYLEEGRGRSIEKSRTHGQGTALMQSGWPKLVFRWDQAYFSRLFILSMGQAPPTSRIVTHPKESTWMRFILRSSHSNRNERGGNAALPPYRITSDGEWVTRFTADVYDWNLASFGDVYLLADNQRSVYGYPILIETAAPVNAPFKVPSSPGKPGAIRLINFNIQFLEPKGRYSRPPFTPGRFPPANLITTHLFESADTPPGLFRTFESEKSSNFQFELYTHTRNEPEPN